MGENLYNSDHIANSKKFRKNYDKIDWSVKPPPKKLSSEDLLDVLNKTDKQLKEDNDKLLISILNESDPSD